MTGARWLEDVRALSAARLSAPVLRYVEAGAHEEVTLAEAEAAWRGLRVLPRTLTDVTRVDTSVRVLGRERRTPLGIAPMTLQRAADPEGEVAMARGAAEAGALLVVSANAGRTFADIGAAGADWWLQAYLPPRREEALPCLRAAVEAGASAVVLTADTPVVATRRSEGPSVWASVDPSWVGANRTSGTGPSPDDRPKARDLAPADVRWLASVTGLPVVVKGVLRGDDARRCVDAGADAVWVSNHGGRQLDQVSATAHCLAGVRAAVGTDAEVYVDGGVRSGLHLMLALALGAEAVMVGRPFFHALAAGGAPGVAHACAALEQELVEAMTLAGCPEVGDTRGILAPPRLPEVR